MSVLEPAELNKLKIALRQVEKGEDIHSAVANAEYVNYDQTLLDKINILKNIPILNTNIIKYLYSIQLTDKIEDVAPKVNAIYQLALASKLIEDKALAEKEAERNAENNEDNELKKLVGKSTDETAVNILKALLNINKG